MTTLIMSGLATCVKVNGQGDFLDKVKGQRPKLAVKILDPGRGRKNRVYGSDTPLYISAAFSRPSTDGLIIP